MKDPIAAYLDSLGPVSKIGMRDAILVIGRFVGKPPEEIAWHEINYEQAQALRAYLVKKYKSRTCNKVLAALRGVLKAAWRLGMMSTDDYHHARDVRVVKISEPVAGRMLSLDELRALVNAPGNLAERHAAMVALMYAAGLRRFEVAKLRVSNYEKSTGVVTVEGKRGKIRQITIHASWRAPIERWLVPLRSDDWMFSVTGALPISMTGITCSLESRRLQAGVAPFSSHDLRRTFITNLIAAGIDLVVVKRLAGHDNVNTTAMYDRRGRDAEVAAIEKLAGL